MGTLIKTLLASLLQYILSWLSAPTKVIDEQPQRERENEASKIVVEEREREARAAAESDRKRRWGMLLDSDESADR